MTEQQAIEEFKKRLINHDFRKQIPEYYQAMELAINALEIVSEIKKRNMTLSDLENYMQFEDECVKKNFTFKSLLEARERDNAIKPSEMVNVLDEIEYDCSECGNELYTIHDYCPTCGKKIDWSEIKK